MKIISRYFVLKYKSCLKAFGKSAAGMLLVFSLLVIGVLAISFGFQQEQVLQKVKIGMVIPESETLIGKGMQFISSMDSIESICEFYYMEEEEAKRELEEGNLQVVIILPVNFYQDVYTGVNPPAEILMSQKDEVNNRVFVELLTSGVSYLQTSESGVYAVLDVSREEGAEMKRSQIGNFVAKNYITELFDRMNLYEEKTVSSLGIVDYAEYVVVMILLFILLLVGTDFSVLYQKKEKDVEQKLKAEGVNSIILSLVKIFIITICLWSLWVLCYSGICIVSEVLELDILWWNYTNLIYGFFVCMSIAAFYHLVYELSGTGTQGSILVLFINMGMMLCSGIIIPSSYLSDGVGFLGKFMPVSLWNTYMQQFMFDEVSMEIIGMLFLVTCIEILVGAVVVWRDV